MKRLHRSETGDKLLLLRCLMSFLYLCATWTFAQPHASLSGFHSRAEERQAPAFHRWALFGLSVFRYRGRGTLGWPLLAEDLCSEHNGPKPDLQTEAKTNKGNYAGIPWGGSGL